MRNSGSRLVKEFLKDSKQIILRSHLFFIKWKTLLDVWLILLVLEVLYLNSLVNYWNKNYDEITNSLNPLVVWFWFFFFKSFHNFHLTKNCLKSMVVYMNSFFDTCANTVVYFLYNWLSNCLGKCQKTYLKTKSWIYVWWELWKVVKTIKTERR